MCSKVSEQRAMAVAMSGGVCGVCGKPLTNGTAQMAHRIADTKTNRQLYGSLVIDSHLNAVMVCSLRCNDACNIGYKPAKCRDLAIKIFSSMIV